MQREPKYSNAQERTSAPLTYDHESITGAYSNPTGEESLGYSGTVDFIFCDHTTPSNIGRALELARVANPDIVAIETPGLSREHKADLEQEMNRIIRGATQIPHMLPGYSDLDFLYQNICNNLYGSGATIKLIDIDEEDPRFQTIIEPANEALLEWIDAEHNESPEAEKLYDRFTDAYALSNVLRENIMTEQIKHIIAENPDQKVAVVLGSAHTPVHHEVSKAISSARQFVSVPTIEPWEQRERMRYPKSTQDTRAKGHALRQEQKAQHRPSQLKKTFSQNTTDNVHDTLIEDSGPHDITTIGNLALQNTEDKIDDALSIAP